MHICEKLVTSAKYLEKHGFTQDQLSSLHHFSLRGRGDTFNGVYNYFEADKDLRTENTNFASRVIYVADQYKQQKGNFSQLIARALNKWPLD